MCAQVHQDASTAQNKSVSGLPNRTQLRRRRRAWRDFVCERMVFYDPFHAPSPKYTARRYAPAQGRYQRRQRLAHPGAARPRRRLTGARREDVAFAESPVITLLAVAFAFHFSFVGAEYCGRTAITPVSALGDFVQLVSPASASPA